ncbi:MAG: hypothetical protein AB7V27_11910 [Candidatus Binatia bacterium]
MSALRWFCIALAAVCLVSSIAVHVAGLAGYGVLGERLWVLFAAWIPALVAGVLLLSQSRRKRATGSNPAALFDEAPAWARRITLGLIAYCAVTLVMGVILPGDFTLGLSAIWVFFSWILLLTALAVRGARAE